MSDLEHARSLLAAARGDLNALRGMTSPALPSPQDFFSDGVFGFHAQQAAEKCLKAWIASLGRPYPRTHDLMALLETLDGAGEDTANLQSLVELNSFAVQYRYDLPDTDDEGLDRAALLGEIETLFALVEETVTPSA